MGKPASSKTKDKPSARPRSRRWLHLVAVVFFCGAVATIALLMRDYVDRKIAVQTEPPEIVLNNRPAWMSDVLADQIVTSISSDTARSTFDHELLVETVEKLKTNPWIETVRLVRRGFGAKAGDIIEIDADYRVPVALVKWGDFYSLVDGKGVKLPEQYPAAVIDKIVHGRDGRVNIRVIEGVFNPPPDPGVVWRGEDVFAGLQMVKLLADQPFAQDVPKVNVENYARRKNPKEAQIVLKTRYHTEIRWGRPLNASDFFIEVSTEQKLASLQQVYRQYGRVDAKQPWLDIRFDKITYPSPRQAVAQ